MRDASICGLGQTASSADRVGACAALALVGTSPVSSTPIWFRARRRRRRPPAAPERPAPPPVDVVIDGQAGEVPAGVDDPGSLPRRGASTCPRSAYLENLDAGQRLPGLRGRGGGRARARPGLLAAGSSRGWTILTDSERVRLSRRMVLELLGLLGRPLDGARRGSHDTRNTERAPSATARPRTPPPAASATPASPATTTRPTAPRPRPSPQPVKVDNDLYVRDYSEVHPLLQVRGGLRRRRAEHLRHRGGRPRLRRTDLHRGRRTPARLRVRVLRQLHRRVPHRRPDVQARARHARGRPVGRGAPDAPPTPSAPTAASAAR